MSAPAAKAFFAAGDDHAADLFVGIKRLQGFAQLVHELVVQCVELFGAVERDDANLLAFGAHFNGFVGHVVSGLGF